MDGFPALPFLPADSELLHGAKLLHLSGERLHLDLQSIDGAGQPGEEGEEFTIIIIIGLFRIAPFIEIKFTKSFTRKNQSSNEDHRNMNTITKQSMWSPERNKYKNRTHTSQGQKPM